MSQKLQEFKVGDLVVRRKAKFVREVLKIDEYGYTLSAPDNPIGTIWFNKSKVESKYRKLTKLERALK